tara:strand:- start:626 stop:760 length:135 start_codon:yes stop_codon:yes gene_type:complete
LENADFESSMSKIDKEVLFQAPELVSIHCKHGGKTAGGIKTEGI